MVLVTQPRRSTILVIGCGDVTANRFRPAMERLQAEGLVCRIAYLDILPQCPLDVSAEYLCLEADGVLPLDTLAERELLGPHVLALICAPTRYHAHYAKQLLGTGTRVAVEKPLDLSVTAANSLLPFADWIFPIGHQLFKADMWAFLRRCQKGLFL